jgi:hypothetical protein
LPGTAVIPDGSSGVDIAVTPLNDSLTEGTETVTMTIVPGAGYGADVGSATLLLEDDDLPSALPSMGFAATTGTTSEAPDATTGEYRDIPVTLPSAMTTTVTVDYIVSGGSAVGDDVDWSYVDAANGNALISHGVLAFPPGTTSRNVRIRVRNDGIVEGAETAILELRNLNTGGSALRLSGSRDQHTLTITDNAAANPLPRVSFLTGATTRTETDGTDPLLIAALDAPSAGPASVSYTVSGTATPGSDYTLAGGTLNFAAGEMFKKLPLVILPDGDAEGAETVIVTLSSPSGAVLGAITTHTVNLTDDNAPVIGVAASTPECTEDSSTGLFTISRLGGAGNLAITVNYSLGGTALAGTDFQPLSGSVLLPANENSVSLPLVPVADTTPEPDKTIVLVLTANPNYEIGLTSEATVTILDDDAAPVVNLIAPAASAVSIPAGVGMLLQVDATRDTPAGTVQMPVTWSQVSGPGTATFEDPENRITGVTFSTNGSYVLRASATHGTTVSTDVTVGVATTTAPGRQVGSTTAPGSVSTAGGTFTVSGAGSGLSSTGTADGFYFVATPRSGDFDLRCRILSFSNPGGSAGSCRFGLMVRADATPGSPYLMSLHKASGIHARNNRNVRDAAAENNDGSTSYTFPHWVRILRAGNDFSAWHSDDGTTWSRRGSIKTITEMGTSPLVGLAITSAVPATASTAVFDSLNFTIAGNVGPVVHAGAAMSGGGPFALDGTVADDGQPVPVTLTTQWSLRSGPGTATFGNAGLVDTSVGFSTGGLYSLRLSASDSEVTTYHDTAVDYSALPPIEVWRNAEFGSDASNPLIAGDLADTELDGVTNLIEYALALDPHADSQHLLPTAVMDADTIALTWRKNKAATDATVRIEVSSDAATWDTVTPSNVILSDDGQVQVIRSSVPRTGDRQFIRLMVVGP